MLRYFRHIVSISRALLQFQKGSRFRKNIAKVAKANILAQSLSLITAPLLTRLYSPADFGLVALFSSILSLLLAVGTFRFEWSIPNAKSKTQATVLIVLGLLFLIGTCLIISFIVLFLNLKLFGMGSLEVLKSFSPLLLLALIGEGVHQLMQAWYIREAQLSAVAQSKISQSIGATSISLAGGFANLGAMGLISSKVVSSWIGFSMLARNAKGLNRSILRLSLNRFQTVWIRFWKESLLSTSVSIVNTASLTVTPLLLAHYYSTTEVGWYAFMYRLAVAPTALFTKAIGQSFWAEAALMVRRDRLALKRLYIKSTKLLLIASIPIISICLMAPFFVGKLFGEDNWAGAGFVLTALMPMLIGQIVVSPLSHLVVHQKQHWQFVWDICRLILVSLTIILGAQYTYNIVSTITLMAIVLAVMYAILFVLNLKCLELKQ